MSSRRTALERMEVAWAGSQPVWLNDLAVACDNSSLRVVAIKMSVSPTLISLVLNNKYHGPLNHLEDAVRRKLLASGDVVCPVLGTITVEQCKLEQDAMFISSSPLRVQLYRACNKPCIHKSKEQ